MLAAVLIFLAATKSGLFSKRNMSSIANEVVLDWYNFALKGERFTNGYRVPVSAMLYGYAGLAGYEAAVPALGAVGKSLNPKFPDLCLPRPDNEQEYYLPAVLNGCYAVIFERFFSTTTEEVKTQHKLLKNKWDALCLKETDESTFLHSVAWGQRVATAVYEWSATDTVGHEAFLHLFDNSYVPPSGAGKWSPSEDFPEPALLPHWGTARTFTLDAKGYLAKPLSAYSTQLNSIFYVQALEIYVLNSPLSGENLWIAEFWSDDHPGLTFTPSGRWISITNQVIEAESPPIEKTLETYLKTGFALNDAVVACWNSKYHYNLERPEAFIRKVIDHDWLPIHHTPPFPGYPSGHSTMGAAVAEVLTQLYGNNFEITDNSHADRTEFKGMPRHFHSFYEMAFENAFSRIPLGFHFRTDCEEGIRLGLLVGKNAGSLGLPSEHGFSQTTTGK